MDIDSGCSLQGDMRLLSLLMPDGTQTKDFPPEFEVRQYGEVYFKEMNEMVGGINRNGIFHSHGYWKKKKEEHAKSNKESQWEKEKTAVQERRKELLAQGGDGPPKLGKFAHPNVNLRPLSRSGVFPIDTEGLVNPWRSEEAAKTQPRQQPDDLTG